MIFIFTQEFQFKNNKSLKLFQVEANSLQEAKEKLVGHWLKNKVYVIEVLLGSTPGHFAKIEEMLKEKNPSLTEDELREYLYENHSITKEDEDEVLDVTRDLVSILDVEEVLRFSLEKV
jgi:hypothetical protein